MKRYIMMALMGLAISAVPATAQLSVFGAGGVAVPTGDDLEDVESGIQLLGGLGYGLTERVGLTVEGQWGTHDIDGSDTSVSPSSLMAGLNLGLGDGEGALRPWVFGQVGIQTIGVDDDGTDPSDSTFGYKVGAGVGFDLFGLNSGLRGSYQAASFDADSDIGEIDFAIFSIVLGFSFPLGGS